MPAPKALSRFTLAFVVTGLTIPIARADDLFVGSHTLSDMQVPVSMNSSAQFFVDFSGIHRGFALGLSGDPSTSVFSLDSTRSIMDAAASAAISGIGVHSTSAPTEFVPEPAPYLLLGTGLLALAGIIQKRRSGKPMN